MADPVSWRRESRRSWYRVTPRSSLLAAVVVLVASIGLAVGRARGSAVDDGSEALIARALGYEAAAARASAKLGKDDPVRLYAMGDETRLGALCAGRPADRSCHFVRLALLAERGQIERFHSAIAASPFRGDTSLAELISTPRKPGCSCGWGSRSAPSRRSSRLWLSTRRRRCCRAPPSSWRGIARRTP